MFRNALWTALAMTGIMVTGCSTTEEATAPQVVTMLTHESFALSEELITGLAAQGITLNILASGDAGSMTASAVLSAGAPTADIIFGVDNTLIVRAADKDVFAPYTSPELANLTTEFQKLTFDGLVTPIDFGDVCINVDTAWYTQNSTQAPTELEQLPAVADQLVVEDPGTSSPGLAFLLATVARFGESWPQYWEQLRDGGVTVAGSWTDAYYTYFTLNGGDKPLVVSYATSPAAEVLYAEDPSITKPTTTTMTDSCYRQVEFAGVLAGAANPAGAEKVIDWLLSPEVQSDIPLSMFVYPVRTTVELPDAFSSFTPVVSGSAELDPRFIDDELDSILTTWGEVMGR
ncbi:MAG: thiamine ABC transporter substrate-binding protein [Candidatus Nanopelagicales bacterium]|nr:thiamine ABC transporter substrate-binding protein [Candidatus Nanopelagicales bacterium]